MKVGTAGWSIPIEFQRQFPEEESQLQSYSRVFPCVEINSTFSKIHLPRTFEKWAQLTPEKFEFSLKLHRSFTHVSDLTPRALELRKNLELMSHLGDKWTVLLLQFPGSRQFDEKKMARFYELIRKSFSGHLVVEPRNMSWLSKESRALMREFKVSKVIADPERCPHETKAILTSGGITYYRLHGSPIVYRSSYSRSFLRKLHTELKHAKNPWCIFDNTTLGKGTGNALTLRGF